MPSTKPRAATGGLLVAVLLALLVLILVVTLVSPNDAPTPEPGNGPGRADPASPPTVSAGSTDDLPALPPTDEPVIRLLYRCGADVELTVRVIDPMAGEVVDRLDVRTNEPVTLNVGARHRLVVAEGAGVVASVIGLIRERREVTAGPWLWFGRRIADLSPAPDLAQRFLTREPDDGPGGAMSNRMVFDVSFEPVRLAFGGGMVVQLPQTARLQVGVRLVDGRILPAATPVVRFTGPWGERVWRVFARDPLALTAGPDADSGIEVPPGEIQVSISNADRLHIAPETLYARALPGQPVPVIFASPMASMAIRVVDARSGEPIPFAGARLGRGAPNLRIAPLIRPVPGSPGVIRILSPAATAMEFEATAEGFVPLPVAFRPTPADAPIEARLVPDPGLLRGRIILPDGVDPGYTHVTFRRTDPDGKSLTQVKSFGRTGEFALPAVPGRRYELSAPYLTFDPAELHCGEDGGDVTVRATPAATIAFDVTGIDAGTSTAITWETVSGPDDRWWRPSWVRSIVVDGAGRTRTLPFAPGRYRFLAFADDGRVSTVDAEVVAGAPGSGDDPQLVALDMQATEPEALTIVSELGRPSALILGDKSLQAIATAMRPLQVPGRPGGATGGSTAGSTIRALFDGLRTSHAVVALPVPVSGPIVLPGHPALTWTAYIDDVGLVPCRRDGDMLIVDGDAAARITLSYPPGTGRSVVAVSEWGFAEGVELHAISSGLRLPASGSSRTIYVPPGEYRVGWAMKDRAADERTEELKIGDKPFSKLRLAAGEQTTVVLG
jgi:hypothetical protein